MIFPKVSGKPKFRFMKKLIFALALGFLSMACFSQPRLPEHYYWEKLPNGLEVVVIENDKVPLAKIEIAVKNGSFTEDSNYNGLSHLLNTCFSRRTKTIPIRKNSSCVRRNWAPPLMVQRVMNA